MWKSTRVDGGGGNGAKVEEEVESTNDPDGGYGRRLRVEGLDFVARNSNVSRSSVDCDRNGHDVVEMEDLKEREEGRNS